MGLNAQSNLSEDTDFVKFWNNVLEPKFTKFRHILQDGLSRYSNTVLPNLPIKRGMLMLDVGCGWGDMAIEISDLVGPTGHVTGIDCVEAFLEVGREEVVKRKIQNVEFLRGDAETFLPENKFDYVVSRFGTMFFTNPVAALKRMRLALKPGGIMTHIVWRDRADCPAIEQARTIALKYLPRPSEDGDNCGPGPFSMANQDILTQMMKSAGYEDITFRRIDEKILVGSNPQEAIEYALQLGPAGEIFREAGEKKAEAKLALIETEMLEYFESQEKDSSGIWIPMSSWVVSAKNPA